MTDPTASLERFVALARVLGLASGIFLLAISPPARRFLRTIRRSARALGPETLVSTCLVVGILSLQLLTGALEQRLSDSNPFSSLPYIDRLTRALARGQRMSVVLIVVAVATVIWNLFVRLPSVTASRASWRWLPLPLWLAWLAVSVLSTALAWTRLESEALLPYAAAALSVLAVVASVPLIDPQVAARLLVAVFIATAAATYGAMGRSHDWAWTPDWPGGFLHGDRLQGIFPQPNVAGVYWAMGLLIVLGRRDVRMRSRLIVAAPMVPLVYWSGSRGAVLLLLVGGLALTRGGRSMVRLRRLAVGCAIVTVAVPLLNLGATDGALAGRAESWRAAYHVGRSAPLLGAGAFSQRTSADSPHALYAHSQLLQTFAESGALGVLLLAAALWIAMRPTGLRVPPAGAVLVGLMATFPFENPIRLFAPSFAAPFVILLVLIGSGERAPVRAAADIACPRRRAWATTSALR